MYNGNLHIGQISIHLDHNNEDLPSPPLIWEQGSSQAWLADSPSHLVTFILVRTMNVNMNIMAMALDADVDVDMAVIMKIYQIM